MLVSVIIPTYDRAGLLLQTLAGLCRQTYRPLQIIIVDDGSTDDTWVRLGTWLEVHAQPSGLDCCRLRQAQAGPAAARNLGFSVARGDLVQFLDSDDRLSVDKLHRQVALLTEEPGLDGVYCAWRSWFDGSLIPYGPQRQTGPITEQEMLLGYMGGTWFLPPHAYLFRRQLLERIGPWDSKLTYEEDAEYLLRMLAAGARFGYVPNCAVDYRRHGGPQVSRLRTRDGYQQLWQQSIAFRRQICVNLPPAQRGPALAALAELAARHQGPPRSGWLLGAAGSGAFARPLNPGRSALIAFGRTPMGALVRRRFGDGLLAWLGLDAGEEAAPPAVRREQRRRWRGPGGTVKRDD